MDELFEDAPKHGATLSRLDEIRQELRQGVHAPRSESLTVKEAGENWIRNEKAAGLE